MRVKAPTNRILRPWGLARAVAQGEELARDGKTIAPHARVAAVLWKGLPSWSARQLFVASKSGCPDCPAV